MVGGWRPLNDQVWVSGPLLEPREVGEAEGGSSAGINEVCPEERVSTLCPHLSTATLESLAPGDPQELGAATVPLG